MLGGPHRITSAAGCVDRVFSGLGRGAVHRVLCIRLLAWRVFWVGRSRGVIFSGGSRLSPATVTTVSTFGGVLRISGRRGVVFRVRRSRLLAIATITALCGVLWVSRSRGVVLRVGRRGLPTITTVASFSGVLGIGRRGSLVSTILGRGGVLGLSSVLGLGSVLSLGSVLGLGGVVRIGRRGGIVVGILGRGGLPIAILGGLSAGVLWIGRRCRIVLIRRLLH